MTLKPSRSETSGMSIIISAWGVPDLLPSCLSSLAAQENKAGIPLEIVLGFDGCAETREAFIRMTPLPISIKPHWLPVNVGPYVAFNTLLPLAAHPYIMFFGADDLALPVLVDAHCAVRMQYDMIRQSSGNKDRNTGELKYAFGAVGLWHSVFDTLGGFRPWRCQADSDLIRRFRRTSLTCGLAGETFRRRHHPKQLTRAEETKIGSPLRNAYKLFSQQSSDIWVEPVTAECVPL